MDGLAVGGRVQIDAPRQHDPLEPVVDLPQGRGIVVQQRNHPGHPADRRHRVEVPLVHHPGRGQHRRDAVDGLQGLGGDSDDRSPELHAGCAPLRAVRTAERTVRRGTHDVHEYRSTPL